MDILAIKAFFTELTFLSILARLFITIICSGVLGWERTKKRRPAGTRTFMLVALGSCLISMLGIYASETYNSPDATRLSAQVISGIGFIGAGTIMSNNHHRVTGITTAAGIWAAACIGLCIGMGFIEAGIAVCVLIIIVLYVFQIIEDSYLNNSKTINAFLITIPKISLHDFFAEIKKIKEYQIVNVDSNKNNINGIGITIKFLVKDKAERKQIIKELTNHELIEYIDILK